MLVSVIEAEITRNQLSAMLGGNSHLTWLSMNSLYLPSRIKLELESSTYSEIMKYSPLSSKVEGGRPLLLRFRTALSTNIRNYFPQSYLLLVRKKKLGTISHKVIYF